MEYKDYYKILGVSRQASDDEIKKAYRKLARKYHPDVSKEADAEARFKEVSEAYEVLRDPEKRQRYNQLGSDWQAGQDFRPPPGWEGVWQRAGQSRPGQGGSRGAGDFSGMGDFSDFFETLFGGLGGARRGSAGRGSAHRGGARRGGVEDLFGGGFAGGAGQDQSVRLDISLEEAYHGSSRSLQLQVPEMDAGGAMSTRTKSLNVKIPAGVRNGQKIRLSGQGGPGMGGGPAGDLYLEVHIHPHPRYRLDARNVTLDLPVAPWEAALGARVPVPTLGGQVTLNIPAGSQSGHKLRLRGRGLPGDPPGDQFVVLKIVNPPADSPKARELFERMKELPFDPRAQLG